MLNLAKIVKPWQESGSLNAQMNLYGFWNNNTFLTKSGDMATVLKVEGIDYESLDKRTQALSVKHLEAALKFFGPDYRIYQYLFKQNNPEIPFQTYGDELIDAAVEQRRKFFESKADSLYQIDIYYVVIYETKRARTDIWKALSHLINDPKRSIEELKGLFTGSRMTNLLKEELSLDAAKLHQRVSAFIRHLQQDTAIEILNSDQQFTFLRRLVNYDEFRIVGRPKSSQYLDYQIVIPTSRLSGIICG